MARFLSMRGVLRRFTNNKSNVLANNGFPSLNGNKRFMSTESQSSPFGRELWLYTKATLKLSTFFFLAYETYYYNRYGKFFYFEDEETKTKALYEQFVADHQQEGVELEARSEMIRVKFDLLRAQLYNKYGDFDEFKNSDFSSLNVTVEEYVKMLEDVSLVYSEARSFIGSVAQFSHEVSHLKLLYDTSDVKDEFVEMNIKDLIERADVIASTCEDSHHCKAVMKFLFKLGGSGKLIYEDVNMSKNGDDKVVDLNKFDNILEQPKNDDKKGVEPIKNNNEKDSEQVKNDAEQMKDKNNEEITNKDVPKKRRRRLKSESEKEALKAGDQFIVLDLGTNSDLKSETDEVTELKDIKEQDNSAELKKITENLEKGQKTQLPEVVLPTDVKKNHKTDLNTVLKNDEGKPELKNEKLDVETSNQTEKNTDADKDSKKNVERSHMQTEKVKENSYSSETNANIHFEQQAETKIPQKDSSSVPDVRESTSLSGFAVPEKEMLDKETLFIKNETPADKDLLKRIATLEALLEDKQQHYNDMMELNEIRHKENIDSLTESFSRHMERLLNININDIEEIIKEHNLHLKHENDIKLNDKISQIENEYVGRSIDILEKAEKLKNMYSEIEKQKMMYEKIEKFRSVVNNCSKLIDDETIRKHGTLYSDSKHFSKSVSDLLKNCDGNEKLVSSVVDMIPQDAFTKGIQNKYSLIERFHEAKKNAIRLAYMTDKDVTIWSFFVSYIHSVLYTKSRYFDPNPYNEFNYDFANLEECDDSSQSPFVVYSLLQAAENAIVDGDIYKALCFISHLKNKPLEIYRSWINDVNSHILTHQAIDILNVSANNYTLNK